MFRLNIKVGLKPYLFLSLFFIILVIATVLIYNTHFKRPSSFNLTIIHQANLGGEIDPCRCLVHPLGGLSYRATIINNIKKKYANILTLDSGDLYFRTHILKGSYNRIREQRVLKNIDGIVDYMSHIGFDAATIGDDDFANGYEFWLSKQKKLNYPIVAINATDENKIIKPYIIKKYGGIKILITGLIDPVETAPYIITKKIKITNYQEKLNNLIKKEKADLVIVLSHSGVLSDKIHVLFAPEIDLILGGHSGHYYGSQTKNNTYLVYPGERGKYVSQINIKMSLDKKNNTYHKEYSSEFFEIDPNNIKPDKKMNQILKKYL